MCDTIAIIAGPEIETPQQFKEWFDFEPLPWKDDQKGDVMSYPCLCGANIDKTFQEHGIAYVYDGMGYIIGDSEALKKHIDKYTARSFFP